MQHIGNTLATKQLSTVQLPTGKEIKNQLPIVRGRKVVDQADAALSDYSDLISPNFKPWYCKMFYTIGAQRFATLASQARADGIDKPKLFSSLLRKEASR